MPKAMQLLKFRTGLTTVPSESQDPAVTTAYTAIILRRLRASALALVFEDEGVVPDSPIRPTVESYAYALD